MSIHRAKISWSRKTTDFQYDTYDRSHQLHFPGGVHFGGSAAPEFKGDAKLPNPEELLVGALSSCHMLTFLALCAKSHLTVDSYIDEAEGTLEKNSNGKLWVSQIRLSPKVKFAGDAPPSEKLQELHRKAHENCFIGNSIQSKVTVA